MGHWLRIILVVLLAITGICFSQLPAWAHAVLERTEPASDAVLPEPPPAVLLWFSEAVEVRSSRISVEDKSGLRVDRGAPVHASTDGRSIRVDLAGVGRGTYSVSWQIMSAVDGHITYGSFVFHVGEPSVGVSASPSGPPPTLSESPDVLGIVTRWANLVAGAVLFAGFAFGLLLPRRNTRLMDNGSAYVDRLKDNLRRPMLAAVLVALLLLPVTLVLQTASAGLSDLSGIGTVLFDTRFGAVWLARIPFLLALGVLVYLGRSLTAGWVSWVGLAVASLFILSFSVISHAAAVVEAGLLPTISDWAHSLAAAFWLGGLIHLGFGFLGPDRPTRRAQGDNQRAWRMPATGDNVAFAVVILPAFSTLAMLSIGILVATGLYNAWLQLGPLESLFSTSYGQALLTKMVISLIALSIGAYNSLRVAKLGAQADVHGVGSLGRSVRIEAGVVLAIFLSVAVLVALPTGREAMGAADHNQRSQVQQYQDLSATLEAPGGLGANSSEDLVWPEARTIVGLEAFFFGLALIAAAWYRKDAMRAPLDRAISGVFNLLRPSAGQAPRNLGLALVFGTGAILAVTGLYFLLGQLLVDVTATRWPRNPVPATAESRALGKDLYGQLCLECHGPDGEGDGPRAREFTADMDLPSHVLAHPSGLLYIWISDGMGDGMPSYGDRLSDEQRWHVVNYIRTFGQASLFGGHAH